MTLSGPGCRMTFCSFMKFRGRHPSWPSPHLGSLLSPTHAIAITEPGGGKKLTAAAFLHDIENLGSLADYVDEADQTTYGQAAKLLEDVSPVRQIRLSDETESFTVLLVLARNESSSPGVISYRIDT